MSSKIEKHTISEKADIMHRSSSLYMASNIPIDYGTGEMYTPVEVHMLKYIKDHPGKMSHSFLWNGINPRLLFHKC